MSDPTTRKPNENAGDAEKPNGQPNQQPGFYDDENRVDSGRDAEFGGNQGMGSYSQHSDYQRHLDDTSPDKQESATLPHQHGPSSSGATSTIQTKKDSKE